MDYSILKQQILDDIKTNSIARDSSKALSDMIKNDQATYKTAADYSKILGSVVSNSINNNIPDGIPDDELGAFADECLVPVYKKSQDTMLNACKNVQQIYNKQAGVGIKPAEVKRDESRTQNISKRFNEAEKFDDVSFLTNENVARSITRGAVNDSIRENSRMQSDAGLKIRISRTDGSGCCQWCAGLVGDYDSFEKLPADFWKIHRNCSCVIDYNVGKTNARIGYKTDKNGDITKENAKDSIIDWLKDVSKIDKDVKIDYNNIRSFEEIQKHFEKKYGIKIDEAVKELNLDYTSMSFSGIERVLDEFPQSVEYLRFISSGTKDNSAMFTMPDGTIYFNSDYYGKNSGNGLLAMITGEEADIHPKNTGIVEVGGHEMAHILELALIESNPRYTTQEAKIIAWDNNYEAKKVVSMACANARTMPGGIGKTDAELKAEICFYATKKDSECLAEAVAEYMSNGENASLLSKEIWKELKISLG